MTDVTVDTIRVKGETVWDGYRQRTIWVAYRDGMPIGNLRQIGTGPHADMEFRWTDRDGKHCAMVAPMAGSTNPVDAIVAFIERVQL